MTAGQNTPADLSQIKAALTAHAQELELEWNDPATEEALARVESELGVVPAAEPPRAVPPLRVRGGRRRAGDRTGRGR